MSAARRPEAAPGARSTAEGRRTPLSRYLKFGVPLALFLAVVAFLAVGLQRDPRLVPSPLIGKSAPEFALATVKDPARTLSRADLLGQVTLLNAWATWCVSCRAEHPVLLEIARSGVSVYGLNYKDDRAAAVRWLADFGDPYVASAYDVSGRVGIDYGVYGLPETFIIDPQGRIAYKQIGPITPALWRDKIRPLVEKLRSQG